MRTWKTAVAVALSMLCAIVIAGTISGNVSVPNAQSPQAVIPVYQDGAGAWQIATGVAGLPVTLTTLLAGEDQTNNVIKVEGQFSYCVVAHADTVCKASAGFVHTVTCNGDAAATAGTLQIRDATSAGTGTVVHLITYGTGLYPPATMLLDMIFPTGITLDFTTTADVDCSVSYR